MIDIIPRPLDRKQTDLEIHNLEYWMGLLRQGFKRDSLVESVYRNWLDYLCDRGIQFLQQLALSPLFYTFPIDHLAKMCVSLTMPVLTHIISYRECLTATSYQGCLAAVFRKMRQTAMAYKFSFAAVVSASCLLLSNPSAIRRICIWVLKYSRSRGVLKMLLLYFICKCIPTKTLLSLAGEEETYQED
ncbi:uncharacterized protein AKAW2_20375S [Aspergillus luchuensis]|uniref:Uncharacterized protein n=1 Tax=Aspergillus kawachii TaxID=1069201 RepID=A0A7R7ZUV8_ASPKA|nr:uncharacterized protein AKAW2_20375S [Aspergillus luchuensis]BCR95435.1 hypothetical protein AKAW2_20375S [Aspergillus luchuensis]BCS07980.1 hypothetical protein ALUC_20350S [Aspergillus luchuensis]